MFLWRSKCVTTWRGAALLMVLVSLGAISITIYIYYISRLPFKVPKIQREDCIPGRRELARRVMVAQRQVEALTGQAGGTLAPSVAQELRAVARELDPRVSMGEGAPALSKGYVCEEVFRGPDPDGAFLQVQCDDVPPFKEVLTIILSTKGWSAARVATVLLNIRKKYDVPVVVLRYGSGDDLGSVNREGVTVRSQSLDTSTSSAINKAAAEVQTPYVLLADSLTHFAANLCSLERLVRVLDHEGQAAAAAGSFRTLDGTWHHGCLQRRLENYQLAYVAGYEHSSHDCMFCDDVVGPFVTRTSMLQKVPLQDELEGPAALRDWFINVHLSGSLAVACPDVMFFVADTPAMTRQEWLQVAARWAVQDVWPHDGEALKFTCQELDVKCVNLMNTVSSFLEPPCCREALRHELGLMQECGEEIGLYIELQAGSLLGAVKTDGILPWDFDMDVLVDCKDQEVWVKKGTECMSRKGCSSAQIKGSYWMTTCDVSFIDLTCRPNRLTPLPLELRGVPTRANYNGRMIIVPPNPALVARNSIGPGYLRHEVHWRHVGEDKSFWNRCAAPGFHACLENFPTDGNIKFKTFPEQLVGL